jgi:CheY-like chemotaxis protein
MPILLITGYSENDFPLPEEQENRLDRFLRKPFQLADLQKSLEELLF